MKFEVLARDPRSGARVGRVTTAHGTFATPCFMPVGSKGAVKTLPPRELEAMGVEILLSNTYHLRLRPGDDLVKKLGGLHKFMGWNRPILTDSGGYQVFSLARLRKVSEDGVEFQSHIDGSTNFFTPELVVDIQRNLGGDIMMPLDHVVGWPAQDAAAKEALERTTVWLKRSFERFRKHDDGTQALFAIVQGGFSKDLRRQAIDECAQFDPPGFSIGGLSVDEPKDVMQDIMAYTAERLPEDRPRYAMGVGTPEDIVFAVRCGVDMFDCILPTRMGRTGWAYTSEGAIKLRNAEYKEDTRPIDPACPCAACRQFSRAFVRHCFNVNEILGLTALSYHNVYYYISLMRRIRESIIAGTFR